MKKKGAIILGLTALMFSSCIEHEVIPAPIPTVDLTANFIGDINGAEIVLTENVLSFANVSTKDQIILAAPDFSSAVYYSAMISPSISTSIKVGLGSVSWNANVTPDPSIASFNSFMLANAEPNPDPLYSTNGTNGFAVTYTDATGREWKTNEASVMPQDVKFIKMAQDSDNSGDYSSFTCNFNCYAYSLHPDSLLLVPPVVQLDSISIENAVYDGWFKR